MMRLKQPRGLPSEHPLRIFVNDKELVTLIATPEKVEELIYGWLWSNGLIAKPQDILKTYIDIDRSIIWVEIKGDVPESPKRTIGSGCGGGLSIADMTAELPAVDSDFVISTDRLIELFARFQSLCKLYKETGGVHGASLADAAEVLYVAEDIGRHNAVDKVIGWALINSIELKDKLILTTGRISSEMLGKVARAGLPVAASRSAATDRAVELADKAQVTLVGYMRGKNASIYTHGERLIEA